MLYKAVSFYLIDWNELTLSGSFSSFFFLHFYSSNLLVVRLWILCFYLRFLKIMCTASEILTANWSILSESTPLIKCTEQWILKVCNSLKIWVADDLKHFLLWSVVTTFWFLVIATGVVSSFSWKIFTDWFYILSRYLLFQVSRRCQCVCCEWFSGSSSGAFCFK